MQKDKSFTRQVILLVVSCLISLIILFYFWGFHDFNKKINLVVMILALCYIIIELIKKNIFKQVSKWNRIYYIGLFAIISPIALENKVSLETIKWINHLGLFFLIIPLMLEAAILIKIKKS
ncbi:MAG: hypothetical protein V4622_04235 [Bacteroidota bacterium]